MRLRMLLYIIVASCWGKTLSIPQHILNESNLLRLLGLKERPKVESQKLHVPETLKELFEIQNNLDFDTVSLPLPGIHTSSANTIRSFVHVESAIDTKFASPHKFRLKFDTTSIPSQEKLKAAQIHISRQPLNPEGNPRHRLLVHDILKPGVRGMYPPIMRVIDSQLIDVTQNTTLIVDVYPAAERWFRNPASNHGVLIQLHSKNSSIHLRLKRDGENWWQHQPLLYTYTDDGVNQQRKGGELAKLRQKRGANNRHRKNEVCGRRAMTVDFKDVGWSDWIVAPLSYDAYYCAGECNYPMPAHYNTTNHAIVQSLVNSVKPTEVPKPCCVPTQLSAMSMLYVGNDHNVILKNYKDMVVHACGCR